MSQADILARRERLLGPNITTFYEEPVHLVRGEGAWLWDADGRRYLDCYNNVPHVGHANSVVVEAICAQAATLNTHTRYLHKNILKIRPPMVFDAAQAELLIKTVDGVLGDLCP